MNNDQPIQAQVISETATAVGKVAKTPQANLTDSLKNISALSISENELPNTVYMPLLALQKATTLADAATSPTVTQIIKFQGEPVTTKIVCAILKLFNDGLNTTLQMTPRQLFEYAQIWLDTYRHDTIKDLILCLKQAKAGRYGPIFNRVDGTVVSEFFRQYLLEKADWGEQQNRQHISDRRKVEKPLVQSLPTEQQAALGELMKKPHLRKTPAETMPTHEQYLDWLRENLDTLELDTLNELAVRAGKQGVAEVSMLVEGELERRRIARFIQSTPTSHED